MQKVLSVLDSNTKEKFGRYSDNKPESYCPDFAKNYWVARKRSDINTLNLEEGGKALRLIWHFLGKKPDGNSRMDMAGHKYLWLDVFWGVSVEDGIQVSNFLAENNFTEFKITSFKWLKLHLNKGLYVTSFYTSDDPAVWKQLNDARSATMQKSTETKRRNREAKRRKAFEEFQIGRNNYAIQVPN